MLTMVFQMVSQNPSEFQGFVLDEKLPKTPSKVIDIIGIKKK